jgi:hypothetical protein
MPWLIPELIQIGCFDVFSIKEKMDGSHKITLDFVRRF